ncbi:MAG: hypothetical protein KC609_14420 [Myxococcales bacterium]|nr:hypothetical protein [Myxococcales bacterium]
MIDDAREPREGANAPEPEPALRIRMGSKPGASLRVKALGLEVVRKEASIIDAVVSSFREVAVATSGKAGSMKGRKTNRCLVLVPSETEDAIEWHDFFVRGRFSVEDKILDSRLASEFFREFQPE